MIKLIERHFLLKQNNVLANFIADIQDTLYNPVNIYEGDELNEPFVNELTTKFELDKDKVEKINMHNQFCGELTFQLPTQNLSQFLELLPNTLSYLLQYLRCDSLSFILSYPTPWLFQKNDFEFVQQAYSYFKSIGVTGDFKGGFVINSDELTSFLPHLYWLTRSNAALPECYFSFKDTELIGHICQYGSIHFYFYSEIEKSKIEEQLQILGLKKIEANKCGNYFTETLVGRQTLE